MKITSPKFSLYSRVLSALLCAQLLSSCAVTDLTEIVSPQKKIGLTTPLYPDDADQLDNWLDNASAWRFWDVSLPSNKEVEWSFEENAISVHLEASKHLNLHDSRAHTLILKVVQFSDVAGYKTLAISSGGIRTILVEDITILPGAIYVNEVLLAPNQVMTINVARQQDTKFIAVVAGYADLKSKGSTRLLPVPVVSIPAPLDEPSLVDKVTLGIFAEPQKEVLGTLRPARLKIDLELGETKIESFSAKSY